MYCPNCGKEIPEGSRFCMHCGADLSGYKVEISPKISVSAKAEGGVALKWKKKPEEGYLEVEGYGKLPLYRDFVKLEDKPFCPLCGNYDCLEVSRMIDGIYKEGLGDKSEKEIYKTHYLYSCLACEREFLKYYHESPLPAVEKYLIFEREKIPLYEGFLIRSSGYSRFGHRWKDASGGDIGVLWKISKSKWMNWRQMIKKHGWEKRWNALGDYWILRESESVSKVLSLVENGCLDKASSVYKLSNFLSLIKGEYSNLDDHISDFSIWGISYYKVESLLCPMCKQSNCVTPVVAGFAIRPDAGELTIMMHNGVIREYFGIGVLCSLWRCKNCSKKFLIDADERFLIDADSEDSISIDTLFSLKQNDFERAYPAPPEHCEFCGDTEDISSCYVCGKGICENCAILTTVKKGLFSKEPVKICPDCDKKM